ncbi:hypothetical protein [Allorhodopirellula solitaria]|uniref:Bacterial type II secretion system protein G n=1 Tax=Allorhodopirellula solitaria TaxID=2527987 RepID=A0A5C5XXE3_9BACT|nr:hypothetical protein [Allorhodopirellula solitaria]TWT66565.1 hypothetical protein CA85_26620 [Allorhodopirellula solitaria]
MKHRLKQLFKICLALIAILVIVVAFFSWRSFAAVEAALEPIRERGEPVSIVDLKPAPVADDENAATFLTPMVREIEQVVNEAYSIAYAEDFSWRTGLTQDQTAKLRTILDAHPNFADQLAKSSRCSKLAWPLDYDSGPNDLTEQVLQVNQDVRSIARIQAFRVRYLAAIDKPDEAAAVCLEELRLIRLQADTPLLVSWLVNSVCRVQILTELNGILQTETLQPETHAAIEEELNRHAITDSFTQTLKTERVFGIESFRGFSMLASPLTPQLENYIEYMNEQIEIGTAMPFESSPKTKVTAVGMTELLVPSIQNAHDTMFRTLTIERCLRILNASQSRPDSESSVELNDLGLPADAIIDPYRGEPLIAKSTEDGWIIYSVGKNGKDDGGEIAPESGTDQSLDIGIGPPAAR